MSTTTILIDAPRERVFDVLSDAKRYADWVVGTQSVPSSDPDFPEVGKSFSARVGVGPLLVGARTTVLESSRPERLVLLARTGPLGRATITILLSERSGGTHVTFREEPSGPTPARMAQRLGDPLLRVRNLESLRRLKRIAERDA